MRRRFILFLIRRKLGVKIGENFQFVNQKSEKDHYFFDETSLRKWEYDSENGIFKLKPASVSLNWMINPGCEVKKYIV